MLDYINHWNMWRYAGPPHLEQRIDPKEGKNILRRGGYFVRNTYDFDCPEKTDYWYIVKDRFLGFDELTANTKSRVNKAFEHLDYRLTDISLIKEQGYPIIKATYEDYAVSDRKLSAEEFQDMLHRLELEEHDCWGIFDKADGKLIGYQINRLWENACEYTVVGVLPEYKRNQMFPYYGLFYRMNEYYLKEKGFRYVTDGSRSITEHSNIQPFLEEKFHFRKAYCHLAIYYQWWMRIAVAVLYPFRRIITNPKVKAVLNIEAMSGK